MKLSFDSLLQAIKRLLGQGAETSGSNEKEKGAQSVMTTQDVEKIIRDSMAGKLKKDISISFDINSVDIDYLAKKFPSQKLYLQGPVHIKIEEAPTYKTYRFTIAKVSELWGVKNLSVEGKIIHMVQAKVSDLDYKSNLCTVLKPLSKKIIVQYRDKDYKFSDFKSAVYRYKSHEIDRIEDYFGGEFDFKASEDLTAIPPQPTLTGDTTDISFVAIDFETANSKRSSACSVGLVVVKNGIITERMHRYINPGQIEWGGINIGKHGIRPKDVEDSPLFNSVWGEIFPLINGNVLVAHNASSFDMSVLRACLTAYSIPIPQIQYWCTMNEAKRVGWPPKLKELSGLHQIKLDHHNALSDADACAQIAIKLFQIEKNTEKFSIRYL